MVFMLLVQQHGHMKGLISGLASFIAGVSPVDGVLATDEVNDAAF